MAKIDLEKLICSLAERNIFLRDALKEQGLEYKDGEIVEIQKSKVKDLSNYVKFLKSFHCWNKIQLEIIDKYLEEQTKKNYSSKEDEKASFSNRQLYNRAILKILSNYIEKYPDIRFGQMLCNLGINPHFDEESKETYWNLSKTINKKS